MTLTSRFQIQVSAVFGGARNKRLTLRRCSKQEGRAGAAQPLDRTSQPQTHDHSQRRFSPSVQFGL